MTPIESAALDDRIRSLQWRTIGVGWTASAMLAAGAGTTLLALGDLGDLIFGGDGDGLVAFHVPTALRQAEGWPLLSMLFAGLALAGGWGLSTGRLRRSHSYAAFALCLLVAIADFQLAAPLHKPLFGMPSRLERLVSDGAYAEADRLLVGAGHGALRQRETYVRAQIALHAGDMQRLESLGRPLLKDADDYAYAGLLDPTSAHVYREAMGDLRVAVLAAIDRRLNGRPATAAGIAIDAEENGRMARGRSAVIMAASGFAVMAAGLLLVALWRRMRGNVLRIIDLTD